VKATAAYYRDVLGFEWDFGDKEYCVVWRDNSAIHFARDDRGPTGIHLFQWVRDVDSYYREILDRGAEVIAEPTDRGYNIRELSIRDPNGIEVKLRTGHLMVAFRVTSGCG
jgi:predicted enzyme related to lactoylglutathione lyase